MPSIDAEDQMRNWVFDLYTTMPHSNSQEAMNDRALQKKMTIYVASLNKHRYPKEFFTDETLVEVSESFKFFPELKELIDYFTPKMKAHNEKLEDERKQRAIGSSNQRIEDLPKRDQLARDCYLARKNGRTEAQIRNSLDFTLTYFPNLKPFLFPDARQYGLAKYFYRDRKHEVHTKDQKAAVSEMVDNFGLGASS